MNPNSRHYKYLERSLEFEAKRRIDTYFVNLPWSEEYECLADAGCGTGNITREFLLPACLTNMARLYAFDISKDMIQTAKTMNSHPRIEYLVADIDDKTSFPNDWEGKFTKVFSHFCLHWLKDFRRGIRNLYDMLRAEGYLLAVIVIGTDLWDIGKVLKTRIKWAPYLKDLEKHIPWIMRTRFTSDEQITDLFQSAGFKESVLLERNTNGFPHTSFEELKESLRSLGVFNSAIPQDLWDEFLEEYAQEIVQRERGKFDLSCESVTILAKK